MKFSIDEALTRTQAVEALTSRWEPKLSAEEFAVEEAAGRILACDCTARYNLPQHRVSAMDGIAVCSAAFAEGMPDTTTWQEGIDYVRADTGDDFPDAFDAVIAIEDVTHAEDGSITLTEGLEVQPGRCVRAAGATMAEGELLGAADSIITPEIAALLAAGGWASVPVKRRLRIGYLPTGSELVPIGTTPKRGENIQSNSVMLSAYWKQWGAEPVIYDIVPDDRDLLASAIDRAILENDVVIVNGGSSRGSEDFNSELLQERATFFAHGVKAVPGRPIGMAIINGKPVINVPGPMIAAGLANDWLIRALICHAYKQPLQKRVTIKAVLDEPLISRPGFERLVRLELRWPDGMCHARTTAHGATTAQSVLPVNGFVALPPDSSYASGDTLDVEVLDSCAPVEYESESIK